MLKNDKLKKPVGGSDRTGFSKIIFKKVLPVFLLTGFLFSPFKINGVYAQILETTEKTESLEFDKYDDLLEYTENTKTKEVIYNYKTNIVGQQTFNNLNENIEKREEDKEVYFNVNTGKELYKIYSGNEYRKIENEWFKFETATTTENNFFIELEKTVPVENFFDKMISFFEFKKTLAQEDPIYANSGSGRVRYDQTETNWTTAHNAESGSSALAGIADVNVACWYRLSDNRWIIERGFLNFDTSILDNDKEIESAILFIKPVTLYNNDNDEYAFTSVVIATNSSTSTLGTADYSRIGSISLSDNIQIDSQSTSLFTEFNLNSTGIANINNDGYSKFGLREGHDLSNVAINGTQSAYVGIDYWINTDGTSNDTYLLVTMVSPEIPATTTPDMYPCEIPENTLIQRFTGCENIYTTSTTTPNEIRYFYYDIPLVLYIVFLIFCTGPLIIIILYIYVRKKR